VAFLFYCDLNICVESTEVVQKFCQFFFGMGSDDESVVYISKPEYMYMLVLHDDYFLVNPN
jgi:hypothetical protein